MRFTKPRALKMGDTVGIFAPSDYVTRKRFDEGIAIIKSWGLRVKYSNNLFKRVEDFMAGTADERADDLRQMIFDDSLTAIWAAEGGYAATDIRWIFGGKEIEHLKKNPKWFIGYSDVGVLTNALFAKGITSVCGPNVWGLSYWKKESREWLRKLLFGKELFFPDNGKVIIAGEAKGRLLASNLESLAVSLGTKYDPILNGEGDLILAIEDWKYGLSSVQRWIEAIFDHARFDRICGIILGRFSLPYEFSYPKWARETNLDNLILNKLLRRKRLPLVKIPYFGHPTHWYFGRGEGQENNLAMPSGIRVSLSASKKVSLSCLERVTS